MSSGAATNSDAKSERRVGKAILRPAAILALSVLVLNDHVFKIHWPNALTGKLSDVAGLVVCPVFLVSCFERAVRRPLSSRSVAAICVVTAGAFALVKTWPAATEAYRVVWAMLRWPLDAVGSLLRREHVPGIGRVAAVRDPSDLVALPAMIAAYFVCTTDRRTRGPAALRSPVTGTSSR